jgi:hypothetical protein
VESDDVEETKGLDALGRTAGDFICACSGEDQVTGPNLKILMLCHDSCLPCCGKSRHTKAYRID